MEKVRIADCVISINRDDEGQLTLFIAKNRDAQDRIKIGPMVCDYMCGRISATMHPTWWEAIREAA